MLPFHHMHDPQSILLITNNYRDSIKHHFSIELDSPNPDIYIITPDQSIGIDQIREIKSYAQKLPFSSKKFIILPDFHMATLEAQNAFLKLLEEPPIYLTTILTTNNQFQLLDTILSRCHFINDLTFISSSQTDILSSITQLPIPKRLSQIPTNTKSKVEAISWCQELLNSARSLYNQKPNPSTLHNLKVITSCLSALDRNANPTLTLTDTLLQLKS